MTKQTQAAGQTAAEASRRFYADPTMRVALALQQRGIRGVPSHADVERAVGREVRQGAGLPQRVTGNRITRQAGRAVAGRPVQPLPTRTARKVRATRRRMTRRLGVAAPVALVVMIVLVFLIPPVAAVTMALSVGALVLANVR